MYIYIYIYIYIYSTIQHSPGLRGHSGGTICDIYVIIIIMMIIITMILIISTLYMQVVLTSGHAGRNTL